MYIILFSGGISSFEVAVKILNCQKKDVKMWFFDTKIEDPDTYRFIKDSEKYFNHKIEIFSEGRNPWEVFRDERFIGNSRVTPCNRVLKRQFLEKLLREYYPKKKVTLCFGINSNEKERAVRIKNAWDLKGINSIFPILNRSIIDNNCFEKRYKIRVPRLYRLGFKHNNCGGACVKAGVKQWIKLLQLFPDRYFWHAKNEDKTRKFLQKNVSILRDRTGGITKPLTLFDLKKKIENIKAGEYEINR